MAKIIKLVNGAPAASSYSLIKLVENNAPVDEGLGDLIGKAAGGIKKGMDAVKNIGADAKKAYQKSQDPHGDVGQTDSTITGGGTPDPNLTKIVGEALYIGNNVERFVAHLSTGEVTQEYLKKGGGAALAATLDAEELVALAQNPASGESRIVLMKKPLVFHKMFAAGKFSNDVTVVIDVPKSLLAELTNTLKESLTEEDAAPAATPAEKPAAPAATPAPAATAEKPAATPAEKPAATEKPAEEKPEEKPTDNSGKAEKIRAVLTKILDHRYYRMTIDNAKAKQVVAKVETATSTDEKHAAFDPNILFNYPIAQVKKGALDEWNELRGKTPASNKEVDKTKGDEEGDKGDEAAKGEENTGDSPEDAEKKMADAAAGGSSPKTWAEYKAANLEPKNKGTPDVQPAVDKAVKAEIANNFADSMLADWKKFSEDGFELPAQRMAEIKAMAKNMANFVKAEGKLSHRDRMIFLTEMKILQGGKKRL